MIKDLPINGVNRQLIMTQTAPWLWAILIGGSVWLLPFRRLFLLPVMILALVGIYNFIVRFKTLASQQAIRRIMQVLLCFSAPLLVFMTYALLTGKPFEADLKAFGGLLLLFFYGAGFYCIQIKYNVLPRLYWIVFATLAFWGLDGLVQAIWGYDFFGFPRQDRLGGFFSTPNKFGFYIGVLSPLVLLAGFTAVKNKALWVSCSLAVSLAVLFANTRWSWVAWFVTLLVLIYTIKLERKVLWVGLFAGGITLLLSGVIYFDEMFRERLLMSIPTEISFSVLDQVSSHRMKIWAFALDIISHHWLFGVGVEGYDILSAQQVAEHNAHPMLNQEHSHQVVLDVLLAGGLLGFTFFALGWLKLLSYWVKSTAFYLGLPIACSLFVMWLPLGTHRSFYASELLSITGFLSVWLILVVTQSVDKVDSSN